MLKFMGFVLLLTLGATANSYAFVIAPSKTPRINVNPSDIYTVTATPTEGNLSYKLAVHKEGREDAVMTITRPLDDYIIDIVINDVDSDGKEELVVFMQEFAGSRKIHFDVFEFERNHLKWVEDYPNLDDLLVLLDIIEIKK